MKAIRIIATIALIAVTAILSCCAYELWLRDLYWRITMQPIHYSPVEVVASTNLDSPDGRFHAMAQRYQPATDRSPFHTKIQIYAHGETGSICHLDFYSAPGEPLLEARVVWDSTNTLSFPKLPLSAVLVQRDREANLTPSQGDRVSRVSITFE